MEKSPWIKCPNCNGLGRIENANKLLVECPTCKGKGIINELHGLPPEEPVTQPNTIIIYPKQFWRDSPSMTETPWYKSPNIVCATDCATGKDTYSIIKVKKGEDGKLVQEQITNGIKSVLDFISNEISNLNEEKTSNDDSCSCGSDCKSCKGGSCKKCNVTTTTNKDVKYRYNG